MLEDDDEALWLGRGWSTRAVTELLDVTYRQLDYWIRLGVLRPLNPDGGSGSRRRFRRIDVIVAGVIVHLAHAGAECTVTRPAAAALYGMAQDGELPTGLVLITPDGDVSDPAGLLDLDSVDAFGWLVRMPEIEIPTLEAVPA